MKRIQYHRYGGPEEMRLEDYYLPGLEERDVCVHVVAAAVNPVDWKLRQGRLKFLTGGRMPRAMGYDFSGVVERVGPEVTRFRTGDEVFGRTPFKAAGAFAVMAVTQESLLAKKPSELSFEQAAALPTPGATAYRALILAARLKAGQRVFINGALGGVGQAATQIARALGAAAAGRVGPRDLLRAKAAGLEPALSYADAIPDSLRRGFDAVFDAHGSLDALAARRLLKPGGVIVDINPTAGKMLRGLCSRRFKIVFGRITPELLDHLGSLAAQGKLTIGIQAAVGLEGAARLIADLEAGKIRGKGLIVPSARGPAV